LKKCEIGKCATIRELRIKRAQEEVEREKGRERHRQREEEEKD